MLKPYNKSLWAALAGVLLFGTTAIAQPGYQWFNAAPGLNGIYFCDNGSVVGDPLDFNEATGFIEGSAEEKSIAASMSEDCSNPIAESSFTPNGASFYYLTLVGDGTSTNPDGEDTSVRFLVTETDAAHAAFPSGTPGAVYVSLAHLAPDAPNVTGIVQETGTVLSLGTFGTVTPLDVPFPSVLGTATIDAYPESQLAAGDTSNPIMTVPVDLASGDAQGVFAAVIGYATPGMSPALAAVAVDNLGEVEVLAGGGGEGRMVNLWLNTASLPDTTSADHLIQVRGCLDGCENDMSDLPDGNVIAWNDNTTLEPDNMGGDYWHTSFMIPDDVQLAFKFYSQQAEDAGIGGWEDGDNHIIEAGTGDVDMGLHFFNKSGGTLDYDWRPFEEKEDSVAIWFRTYANTENAIQQGYDHATSMIGIRGDSAASGGSIDWDITKVLLSPESESEGTPGYDLWSGVAYYPASTAGNSQPFKFIIQPDGWEAQNDRTFTVPAQDTTIHWTLFSDSPVATGQEPATAFTIFSVDLTPLEEIGVFDLARGDTLEIRGGFNGWDCAGDGSPDDCLLDRVPGEPIFEGPVSPISAFPQAVIPFKFFLNFNVAAFESEFDHPAPTGWEEPISTTGANRTFVFDGNPDQDQFLGPFFFNDVYPGNLVPAGTSIDVTFTVDMTAALDDDAAPFNPATDTVTIDFADQLWGFTQGVPGDTDDNGHYFTEGATSASFFSLAPAPDLGANVYQGTYTMTGPTYAAIQYKVAYAQPGDPTSTYVIEPGGSTDDYGRRRTRYVPMNADGSFPATWDFPMDIYQPEGVLLDGVEDNPAVPTAIEPVGTEIPQRVALGSNYPNPFNPSTTFEYSITETQHVQVNVYDLTGRLVMKLVDGVQPAASYRVTFDAESLSSGIYIYQLKTPNTTISKKMLLLK
jgi:hypothetical protein